MDVRIGVINAPREISVELADDADREALRAQIDTALGNEEGVLWLTDKKGRSVAIPSKKVAYVEIGAPDDARRIGFGA